MNWTIRKYTSNGRSFRVNPSYSVFELTPCGRREMGELFFRDPLWPIGDDFLGDEDTLREKREVFTGDEDIIFLTWFDWLNVKQITFITIKLVYLFAITLLIYSDISLAISAGGTLKYL